MTRRLTVGSRSEMGLPHVLEPDTPVSSPWPNSPYKNEYWKVPSRWQTSRPRIRQIVKFISLVVLMSIVLKIYYDKDLPPTRLESDFPPSEHDPSIPDGNWPWKDYPL